MLRNDLHYAWRIVHPNPLRGEQFASSAPASKQSHRRGHRTCPFARGRWGTILPPSRAVRRSRGQRRVPEEKQEFRQHHCRCDPDGCPDDQETWRFGIPTVMAPNPHVHRSWLAWLADRHIENPALFGISAARHPAACSWQLSNPPSGGRHITGSSQRSSARPSACLRKHRKAAVGRMASIGHAFDQAVTGRDRGAIASSESSPGTRAVGFGRRSGNQRVRQG